MPSSDNCKNVSDLELEGEKENDGTMEVTLHHDRCACVISRNESEIHD